MKNKTVTYKICSCCEKEYRNNYNTPSSFTGVIDIDGYGYTDSRKEFQLCSQCSKVVEGLTIREFWEWLKSPLIKRQAVLKENV